MKKCLSYLKNTTTVVLALFNLISGYVSIHSWLQGKISTGWLVITILALLPFVLYLIAAAFVPLILPLNSKYIGYPEKFRDLIHTYKTEILVLRVKYTDSTDSEQFQNESMLLFREMCEKLRELVRLVSGCDARVCIKLFSDEKRKYLYTYCRDNMTVHQSVSSEHDERLLLSECTSFHHLKETGEPYYKSGNIKKKYKKGRIACARPPEDYDATIVAPIRFLTHSIGRNGELQYDLLGFLCVDSKDRNAYNGLLGDMLAHTAKTVADLLYVLFNEVYAYSTYSE